MIRRIIWLLIILGLAYGIYRWIDPVGAEELVARIQSYFDKEKESEDVVVEQEPEEDAVVEQEPNEETTTAPIYTGTLNTGSLVELDYVLSGSTQTGSAQTGSTQTGAAATGTTSARPPTTTTQTTTTTPAPRPTTQKSLSAQDEADIRAFLNAIVE